MAGSSKSPPAEDIDGFQATGKVKSTEKETILCTPFCDGDCAFRGGHNSLILSLVRLQELNRASMEEWKASVTSDKMGDLNQPLEDPIPVFCRPLLHWAATLGKVKAVKWLLDEKLISLENCNRTVVFSMVRNLHEGVKSKDPNQISKIFVRILDLLLKHDSNLLFDKEDEKGDTVLHLCARGDEVSNAPFENYLRGTLVKLQEMSKENEILWLENILQETNREGETFTDIVAKCPNKNQAKSLINFLTGKFVNTISEQIRKAEEILNKRTQDEIERDSYLDGNDYNYSDFVGKDSENETDDASLNSTYFATGKMEPENSNKFEAERNTVDDSDAPPAKIARITSDESETSSEDPSAVEMSLQTVLRNLPDVSDVSESKVSPKPVEEPAQSSVSGVNIGITPVQPTNSEGGPGTESNANELIKAKQSVRDLIRKTEYKLLQEKKALNDATLSLKKMTSKISQLSTEIENLKKVVKSTEESLSSYKESLKNLFKT